MNPGTAEGPPAPGEGWSESQLRLLTDALPVLIAHVDADERYRFNNRACVSRFGRTAGGLRGRTLREVLGEAAYEKIRPAVRRALGGETFSFDALVPYPDGGARHVEATRVPDREPAGAVRGNTGAPS